jgi:hypothetical protein
MIAQRIEILDQLAKHGWDATPLGELEWWADEMWLLVSNWSPVGSRAYLTFIVNPLFYSPDRKKGEAVWAAMVSGEKPDDRYASGDSSEISLNQGWKERLPELLEYLSSLRNKQGTESLINGS